MSGRHEFHIGFEEWVLDNNLTTTRHWCCHSILFSLSGIFVAKKAKQNLQQVLEQESVDLYKKAAARKSRPSSSVYQSEKKVTDTPPRRARRCQRHSESGHRHLYDEYPGKTVVWVRWNPDNYAPPKGTRKLRRQERLAALVRVLREVETRSFETKMHVIYMFYDADNPLLVRNISKELLYA